MKIVAKTLNGKQLPIEIELTWTVRQIKEALEKEHQLPADTLKLIAYGKVLDKDDSTAADYSIKENDFIVAMVQKKKPDPKKKEEPKAEEVKKEEVPAATTDANAPAETQPSAPTQAAQAQPQPAADEPLAPEIEAAINELMSISGKPRELCLQALTAAQNIPDVAFEFLMSGHIPQVPAGGGGQGQEPDYGDEGDEGGDGMGGLGQYNLDPATLQAIQALVSNPSFPMIRQRMIQDPNFSTQFMQQLQQTQPQIFNAIQQNPGILMSLILGHDPMAGMGGGHPGAGGMGGGPGGPPPGSIQVSAEEMASINNLVSLGFTKERAAEAYFACDKNEEMAANFLFEAGAMDEDQATQNAIAASTAESANPGGANPQPEGVAVPQVPAEESQAEGGQAQENADQPKPDNSNNDDKKDEAGGSGGAAGGDGDGGGSSLV